MCVCVEGGVTPHRGCHETSLSPQRPGGDKSCHKVATCTHLSDVSWETNTLLVDVNVKSMQIQLSPVEEDVMIVNGALWMETDFSFCNICIKTRVGLVGLNIDLKNPKRNNVRSCSRVKL